MSRLEGLTNFILFLFNSWNRALFDIVLKEGPMFLSPYYEGMIGSFRF
jgi:hypothetical protein